MLDMFMGLPIHCGEDKGEGASIQSTPRFQEQKAISGIATRNPGIATGIATRSKDAISAFFSKFRFALGRRGCQAQCPQLCWPQTPQSPVAPAAGYLGGSGRRHKWSKSQVTSGLERGLHRRVAGIYSCGK